MQGLDPAGRKSIIHCFQHTVTLGNSLFLLLVKPEEGCADTRLAWGGKNRTAMASFHQLLSSDKSCVLLVPAKRTLARKIQTRSRSVSSIFWFSGISQQCPYQNSLKLFGTSSLSNSSTARQQRTQQGSQVEHFQCKPLPVTEIASLKGRFRYKKLFIGNLRLND